MNTRCLSNRLFHSSTPRRAALTLAMLVALAWSSLAFCGEIHKAARDGDSAKVTALLKDNPDLVFSKDNLACTPLHYAAVWGHKDVAELLLANKAEVNAKNNIGATPLHLAAGNGHKAVAELLLANKAEVNAKNNFGETPLDMAASSRHKDVVELLRQNGGVSALAQQKAKDALNSEFLNAVRNGDIKKMNALAQRGADVNDPHDTFDVEDVRFVSGAFRYRFKHVPGASGPMLFAIRSTNPETVRTLLALGADVKTEFFLGANSGASISTVYIADASFEGSSLTLNGPSGAVIRVENGTVFSTVPPTPARKVTYLSLAEGWLADEKTKTEFRPGLQQIVDLLRQAVQK